MNVTCPKQWVENLNLSCVTACSFNHVGSKITTDVTAAMKLRHLLPGREAMTKLDSVLKSRDITLLTKVHRIKAIVFPVVKYRCESWTIRKTECQTIDASELWCLRRLLSPLDNKEIKPVNHNRNQPWILIGKTFVEAEAQKLCLPDAKSQLIGKDPDSGKDWGQEEKGATEDEMAGWPHQLNGH